MSKSEFKILESHCSAIYDYKKKTGHDGGVVAVPITLELVKDAIKVRSYYRTCQRYRDPNRDD